MKVSPLTKAIVGLTAAGAAYVWVQKRRNAMLVEVSHPVETHGLVSSGYEGVRATPQVIVFRIRIDRITGVSEG